MHPGDDLVSVDETIREIIWLIIIGVALGLLGGYCGW